MTIRMNGALRVHVITRKKIAEAGQKYRECASALNGWYRIIRKNSFRDFAELKMAFSAVDKVGALYVFDIGGNKLRLIASIHFNRQKVYVRHILNHSEYDKGAWRV